MLQCRSNEVGVPLIEKRAVPSHQPRSCPRDLTEFAGDLATLSSLLCHSVQRARVTQVGQIALIACCLGARRTRAVAGDRKSDESSHEFLRWVQLFEELAETGDRRRTEQCEVFVVSNRPSCGGLKQMDRGRKGLGRNVLALGGFPTFDLVLLFQLTITSAFPVCRKRNSFRAEIIRLGIPARTSYHLL